MGPSNAFSAGEMCAVMRPDRSVRFAKISRDNGNSTYDLCTGVTDAGLMHKTGVPAQFICKFPHSGPFPSALAHQVGVLFDLLDVDGSGSLDFHFDGQLRGEMASDLGKRFLNECQVDPDDMQQTYEAMKQLDANGDGVVDRSEVMLICLHCWGLCVCAVFSVSCTWSADFHTVARVDMRTDIQIINAHTALHIQVHVHVPMCLYTFVCRHTCILTQVGQKKSPFILSCLVH